MALTCARFLIDQGLSCDRARTPTFTMTHTPDLDPAIDAIAQDVCEVSEAAEEIVADEVAALVDAPLVGDLQQALDAIESTFLNAGDVLSAAVGGVGELIYGIDRLTSVIDPEMVASITEDLKRAASSLYEIPQVLTVRRQSLEAMRAQAQVLGGSVSDMKRSLSYLGVFTIYVKVAASDVTREREQFTAFADEIGACIAEGRTNIDGFEADLAALEAALAQAVVLDDGLALQCTSLLPTTPNAIISAASGLNDHRQKALNAAESVRSLANSVRRKVGSVLGALQIGDISRQRLEHVRDGLVKLHSAAEDLPEAQKARFLALGHRFLQALLGAAVEDFRCEIEQIARSMAGLAADAEQVLALLQAAYGTKSKSASASDREQNFIAELEANVGTALELVGQVQTVEATAASLGQSATDAALRLTARIGDIQTLQRDVQQMAFNTRLKCSQIGEGGRSLGVIALEIREQTVDMEKASTAALDSVHALEGQAISLSQAVTVSADSGAQNAASSLNFAVERLRSAGDNIKTDQSGLAMLGSLVVQGLQQAASVVDFEISISSLLDKAVTDMADLCQTEPTYDDEIMAPTVDFLTSLTNSYTMAQERSVHQVLAAAYNIPTESADPAPAAEPQDFDLDDLLF